MTINCQDSIIFKICKNERSTWGMKATMVGIHIVLVGGLFLLDSRLIEETRLHPWYTALYLLLLVLTLIQYFYTAGSSPGYVLDVMKGKYVLESDMKHASDAISRSASSIETQVTLHIDDRNHGTSSYGATRGKGPALITPTRETISAVGSSSRNCSCTYCHVWQPQRSKHCHDCDKCVLRFDHHCVWLGTCVGQGNHCRFWWYLFEETVLCVWTGVMYIISITRSISDNWWHSGLEIFLLIVLLFCLIILLMLLLFHSYLVLTNQTTYELIRRRRIPYLRGVPDKVHPFSKGSLRNIYRFCCSFNDFYIIDSLPTREELESKARPYTFWDVLSCRCC
eukprot:Gb_33986 [translate_table: standard]